MKAIVYNGSTLGQVFAPSSKSYAHRLLLAAAFSTAPSSIIISNFSDDIFATISALNALGADIKVQQNTVSVIPIKTPFEKVKINAKESGSTLRFLLPILCALGVEAEIYGEGKLLKRPIEPLLNVLRAHGIEALANDDFISIKGKLQSGRFCVSGEVSSQYITGLLFALSLLSDKSELVIEGNTVSKNYIDMTVEVLKIYKVCVEKKDNVFLIPAKKQFTPPENYVCEGDWSSAAIFAVLGALRGEIAILNLNQNSLQADRKIIDILYKMGADIAVGEKIIFKKSILHGVNLDMTDCPDIIPIVCVACALAEGTSQIVGVDRLKVKESDRLEAIIKMLNAFKIKTEYTPNCLSVNGGKPKGAIIDLEPDHRTVMSACVMGIASAGKTEIMHSEAVNKSYPSFFKDIISVGGKVICTD